MIVKQPAPASPWCVRRSDRRLLLVGETAQATAHVYLSPAAGQVTDQVTRISTESWEAGRPAPAQPGGDTTYAYDFQNHLTAVSRTAGPQERLFYGPTGELLYRQVDEKFVFYVGPYATVTASGLAGCLGTQSCAPAQGFDVDNHVIFAATRIASVRSGASPNRVLYYYRTRLGSVVATTTRTAAGTQVGARYRYTPYGKVEAAENDTRETHSELGYTDALHLTGDLVYLRARVYDAGLRRFVQADEVDRLRYAYVWGDPANLHDPTGLMAIDFGLAQLNTAFVESRKLENARVTEAQQRLAASEDRNQSLETQAKMENKDTSDAGMAMEPAASVLKPSIRMVRAELTALAERYGIPGPLVLAIARTESNFNVDARNDNKDNEGNVTSTDYGLMQVNSRNIGGSVAGPDGTSFVITKEVVTDWKANANAGVALVAQEYRRATRDQPTGTEETRAQQVYSAYNGGPKLKDRYTLTGQNDGFYDKRDRNFLTNYRIETKTP